MPDSIDPGLLDRDLEVARREFAAWERDEGRADRRVAVAQKAVKFRSPLSLFLAVYPLIREADDSWRRSVFQAGQPFDAHTDEAVPKFYAVWLGYSRMFVEEAEYLGHHGADFEDDLARLNKYAREADPLVGISRAVAGPIVSHAALVRRDDGTTACDVPRQGLTGAR